MSDRSIRESVQYLAGTHQTDQVTMVDAIVNSVDVDARTCDVTAINGPVGSDIPDVRLMSSVDDGILILPTVGSTVTIQFSIFTDPLVIGFSGVDQIILMGGGLGGLVKILAALKSFNQLENDVNVLKAAFAGWTPVPDDGGAALKAATSTWAAQQLTVTQQADIENTLIEQG